MKKLFLIVAAMFAVVSFSACSDDDDKDEKNSIIGKWEYTHLTGYDNGVIVVDKDIPKDDGYTEQSVIEMTNSTTLNIIDIDEEDGYDGERGSYL